jgi:phosphoribosylanthranilate isomerase
MFRIKICGVTNVEDAREAIAAGADAIGINFFSGSPRYFPDAEFKKVSASFHFSVRGGIPGWHWCPCVGVVVNKPLAEIDALPLNCIQLHGDEQPVTVGSLAEIPRFQPIRSALPSTHWSVIRARRLDDRGVAAIAKDLDDCERAGRRPDAVLVDAHTPGRYGGTGETVSWVGLADHKKWLGDTPLILAGGLTPENVAEAIRIVGPHGVDVASGVESSPGKKDHAKVRDFVAAAREAFAQL